MTSKSPTVSDTFTTHYPPMGIPLGAESIKVTSDRINLPYGMLPTGRTVIRPQEHPFIKVKQKTSGKRKTITVKR